MVLEKVMVRPILKLLLSGLLYILSMYTIKAGPHTFQEYSELGDSQGFNEADLRPFESTSSLK